MRSHVYGVDYGAVRLYAALDCILLRSNPAILDLLKQAQISTDLRGDNIFALARKDGPPLERHPKELYVD